MAFHVALNGGGVFSLYRITNDIFLYLREKECFPPLIRFGINVNALYITYLKLV